MRSGARGQRCGTGTTLGHASITTTERYDNQNLENLQAAAARLERGETFTPAPATTVDAKPRTSDRKRHSPSNRQELE